MFISYIYNLIIIYITFHPKEEKYTFFSNVHGEGIRLSPEQMTLTNVHGVFTKIDLMIGHQTSLNKFKKTEFISSIFSEYHGLKLETNLEEETQKHSNSWR